MIAFRAKAAIAISRGHAEEAGAYNRQALDIALAHDFSREAAALYFTQSDSEFRRDRYESSLGYLGDSLSYARKLGNRPYEWSALAEMTYPLYMLGRWDEALISLPDPTAEQIRSGGILISLLTSVLEIYLARGRLDDARTIFSLFAHLEESADVQDRSCYLGARATLGVSEGRFREALADAEAAIEIAGTLGFGQQVVKQAVVAALEAALALCDQRTARDLIALLEDAPPGKRSPFLAAQAHRFRGRLDGDEAAFAAAEAILDDRKLRFWLAVVRLEHGELLLEQGRDEEAARPLDEARQTFEQLEATPWLERAAKASATRREPEPVSGS